MQYVIGALSTASFFVCLIGAYVLGRRSRSRAQAPQREVPEEDKRKAESLRKGFAELMSYDVTKALDGKKVT